MPRHDHHGDFRAMQAPPVSATLDPLSSPHFHFSLVNNLPPRLFFRNPSTRVEFSPRPPATDSMLQLRSVTKRYGALTALDDVSLDIARGEFFGLLGPNRSEERRVGKECRSR